MKNEKKDLSRNSQSKTPLRQIIILAFGLILFMAGLLLTIRKNSSVTKVFAIRPVVFLSLSVVLLFLAFAYLKNGVFLFLGIFTFLSGIVFLLGDTELLHQRMRNLWPLIVVASGISLLPAGLYKLKRIRTVYLFPAIALVGLGVFFLLFSLNIIKVSFVTFFSRWWPVILIIFGIALVAIFLWQQSHSKQFPYMADDSIGTRIDTIITETASGEANEEMERS